MSITTLQVDRCVFICSLAKQSLQKQVEVTCLFELSSFIYLYWFSIAEGSEVCARCGDLESRCR